jgi:hypothetical protein
MPKSGKPGLSDGYHQQSVASQDGFMTSKLSVAKIFQMKVCLGDAKTVL